MNITTNSQDIIKQLNNVTVTTVPVDLQQNLTVKADPKVRSAVDNWAKSIVVNGNKVKFTAPSLPSGYSISVAFFSEEDLPFHQSTGAIKAGFTKTFTFNIKSMTKEELEKATAAGTIFLPYGFTFDITLSTNESTAQRFQPGTSTIVVYAASQDLGAPHSSSASYWIDIYKDGFIKELLGRAYFSKKSGGIAEVN